MKKIYCFLTALTSLSIFFMASCQDSIEHSPYVDPNKQVANKIIDDSKELPKDVFISEYFATDLGNFLPYTNNDQVNFEVDYNVAKVTGCVDGDDGKLYLKSDAWIIANTIDLSNQDSVYYSFDQIIAYESGNALKYQTLLISSDFNGDYNSAKWDTLPYSVVPSTGKPASWDKFDNTKFYLDKKYLTSNITFAFKYSSTEEHTSTWEIKNFIVKRGNITETKTYTFKEKQYLSNSSLEKPASVADVIDALTSESVQVYITGFVVGYVDGSNMTAARIITDPAQCGSVSNILLADSPNETNTANCIPINLVSGTQFRTVLNIKDNNDILGKQITLGGYVMSYMSANGLRNLFYSKYGDNVINNGPGAIGFDGLNNVKTKVKSINDTLLNTKGSFSIYNSKCSDFQKLNHIWTTTEKYGIKANAVASKVAYESEAWFISPSIDFTSMTNPEFIFSHALMDFSDIKNYCSVLISTDYVDGNPADANWNKLDISNWPTSTTFVENKLLLTDYKSSNNVHIAFKYTSNTDDVKHAGVWEIKTININEKEPDEIPVAGFDGSDNTSKSVTNINISLLDGIGDFSIFDVCRYAKKDQHIWTNDSKYGIVANAVKENSESWFISPKIDASSFEDNPILMFDHAAKDFSTFNNELKLLVSKSYVAGKNPNDYDWTEVALTTIPTGKNWDYVSNKSELKDLRTSFYFAFVYKSTETNKPKWEIKNLSLLDSGKPVTNAWYGENKTTNTVENISGFADFSILDVKRYPKEDSKIWDISSKGVATATTTKTGDSQAWLISQTINTEKYSDVPEITLSQANFDVKTCKIYISTSYNGSNSINISEWTLLDFSSVNKIELDNTYKGNKINLAFAFEATQKENEAKAWTLNSITVKEKSSFKHAGTKDDPYDYEDLCLVSENTKCYVKGYILGVYNNNKPVTDETKFIGTNIFIASNPDEEDDTKYIPIELPSGVIRTNVNLKDNPSNYKKEIIIYGSKIKYFNKDNAIKSTSFVILNDNEYGPEPK